MTMATQIRAYTDRGKLILVTLVDGRAHIRIGESRYSVNPKYKLADFFRALGTEREAEGLANVLALISEPRDK